MNNAILTMSLILEDQCYNRWVGGARQGGTFREHCLSYFQPNVMATNFLNAAEKEINSNAPYELYMAVLKAERLQFEKYTDEEANEVLRLWRVSKGIT